jgi:DNA-binding transcriptional ArsR family regulator
MHPYLLSTQLLKTLAHPARLQILNALRQDEECVCHLTALLHHRQAYVSQQLRSLRQAGLIEDRKDGLRVYYRVKDPRVFKLLDTLNALAGAKDIPSEKATIATCPCPGCETERKREGGHNGAKSSVRVAPTVQS